MKRRKDIASKLLLIAEVHEMRAAADAASAREALREAVEDVEALDDAEEVIEQGAFAAPALSTIEVQALFQNRNQVREAREVHKRRVRGERRHVAETAEHHAEQRQRVRVREHVRDHVRLEYLRELERREEDELDDLTQARWGR